MKTLDLFNPLWLIDQFTLWGGGGGKGGGGAAAPQEPQKPQEAKTPEASPSDMDTSTSDARRRAAAAGGPTSTLLTGPSGVENNQLNVGKTTLLGQ